MTIDTATNALMQSIETPTLTFFSKTISKIFDPVILLLILIIIASYIYIKVSKKQGLLLGLTTIATAAIIKISKEIFHRIRPLNALIQESSFSIPSGHATMIVVFFGLLTYLFINKKHKITAIATTSLIALIIGFTRVYLRVHWLTDVIAGFALGTLILITAILIYKKY